MGFVHDDRSEPRLKQVTNCIAARVDEVRVTAMRFSDRKCQTDLILRNENKMDVIGHQTVRPDLHIGLCGGPRQVVEIDEMIAAFEEDRLAAISALRHMVRQVRNNNAGETRHVPMMLAACRTTMPRMTITTIGDSIPISLISVGRAVQLGRSGMEIREIGMQSPYSTISASR
jgi:hypothetical protein